MKKLKWKKEWLIFMEVPHSFRIIPTILKVSIKYNGSNIGTIYDWSLQGLLPEASLICPLLQHKTKRKRSMSAIALSKELK